MHAHTTSYTQFALKKPATVTFYLLSYRIIRWVDQLWCKLL